MKIGNLDIKRLSGPVSFTVLIPTKECFTFLKKNNTSILLLLGDEHFSDEEVCEDFDSISTINDNWFRLLDMISSEQYPLDYYIEISLQYKKLNFSEEYRKLIKEKLKNNKTVMYYIISKHIECFLNQPTSCFTKNIRYHAVDIRNTKDGSDFVEFKIHKHIDYFWKFYSSENQIKGSNDSLLDIKHFINLFCDNVSEFSNQLYNFIYNNKDSSGIMKQIDDQNNKELDWKGWFNEYFYYCEQFNALYDQNYLKKKQKLLNYLNKRFEMQKNKQIISNKSIGELSDNIEWSETSYNFIYETIFCYLFSPLLEIYFILRLWKNVTPKSNTNFNPSWCSIFQGGGYHTERLTYYLIKKKLYKFESSCQGIIGNTITQFAKNAYSLDSNFKQKRCIDLSSCFFHLDLYNPNKEQLNLLRTRINILGYKLFFLLLSGYKFTEDELVVYLKCSKSELKKVLQSLQFQN